MNPHETIEKAAEASGLAAHDVMPVLRVCRWSIGRIEAELAQHGANWFKVAEAKAKHLAAMASVSRIGPHSMRKLSGERIGQIVKSPVLNRFAETYKGGNALLLGPTRVGKSLTAFRALRLARYRRTIRQLESDPNWTITALNLARSWWKDGSYEVDPYFLDGWADATELNRARLEHPLGHGECFPIEATKKAGLVVLDEIGLPRNDDLVLEILWHRYNAGKFTIVTVGGLTRRGLENRFGDAAIARMLESNGRKGTIIDLHEGDGSK